MRAPHEEHRPFEMPEAWRGVVPSHVFLEEAVRLVEEAESRGLTLRALGGVAIRLHSPGQADLAGRLRRLGEAKGEFTDLDFMSYRNHRRELKAFLGGLGYRKRRDTLSTVASDREIYFHPKGWFFVDVFYDRLLVANHPLDFRGRLALDRPTVPLVDLLLEKLQIVMIGDKDVKDVLVLLADHSIGPPGQPDTIDVQYAARLLGRDWGLWYTVTTNLKGLRPIVHRSQALRPQEKSRLTSRIENLLAHFERAPKGLRWRARAVIGPRLAWYQPVETAETVRGFGIWRLGAEGLPSGAQPQGAGPPGERSGSA
jgi:hypothetical protein